MKHYTPMPKYSIQRYQPRDVYAMPNKRVDRLGNLDLPLLDVQGRNTFAYTIRKHGSVVAVGGFGYMWPDTASAWMAVSEDLRGDPIGVTKLVQCLIASAVHALKVYTVIAYVHAEVPENVRWAKLLGFHVCGRIPDATADGSDVIVMALSVGGSDGR